MPDNVPLGGDGRGYFRGRREEKGASHGPSVEPHGSRDALLHDYSWLVQQLFARL